MPNKYYLREDRKAVKPEMNEPEFNYQFPPDGPSDSMLQSAQFDFACAEGEFHRHLFSLPALEVDPDYLKTLRPGWFEGEERYEHTNGIGIWLECSKEDYYTSYPNLRRLTIVAPQEAEKDLRVTGVVQDVDRTALEFDKIRSEIALVGKKCIQCGKEFTDRSGGSYCSIQCWDAHCLHGVPHLEQPATPQPVTGEGAKPWEAAIDYCNENGITVENELRQNFKSFLAGHSYAAASRPSDAVEFAEWLCRSAIRATDNKYWVYNGENFYTTPELYQLFLNSKSPNPNK